MKKVKAAWLLITGLTAGLLLTAVAHAAPVSADCADTQNTTANNRGSFHACLGAEVGHNVIGSGEPWLSILNTVNSTGMGGYTNWVFDVKFDDDGFAGANTLGFSLGPNSLDATSGTWHLATATTQPLVLALWGGNRGSAYFWDGFNLTDGGTWDTLGLRADTTVGLSGAALFLAQGVSVPEPGTVGLIAAALLGLGLMRRRGASTAAH